MFIVHGYAKNWLVFSRVKAIFYEWTQRVITVLFSTQVNTDPIIKPRVVFLFLLFFFYFFLFFLHRVFSHSLNSYKLRCRYPSLVKICNIRQSGRGCSFIWMLSSKGGAVASWLVRSSPERVVRVRALAGDIVLCSWARHLTLAVPLSTQVYK